MSRTRSQIARQLFAEGGAPRKGFKNGGVNEADVEAGLATQTMADFAPSEGGYEDIDMSYTTGNEFNVTPKPPSFFENLSSILIKGKGGQERVVPLFGSAVQCLKKYLNLDEIKKENNFFLFPSGSKDGHITRHRFFQLLKKLKYVE